MSGQNDAVRYNNSFTLGYYTNNLLTRSVLTSAILPLCGIRGLVLEKQQRIMTRRGKME